MLRILIPILFLFGCNQQHGTSVSSSSETGVPSESLSEHSYIAKYDTTAEYLMYSESGLVEDFNEDGFQELVSLVANSKNNEIGVRIIDGRISGRQYVFGAGNEVDGLSNHRWIASMELIPKGFYVAPALIDSLTGDKLGLDSANGFILKTNAIRLKPKYGHAGAFIYWDGKDYSWMGQ